MVWLLHILNGFWNAFVIRWKLRNDSKASKIWHRIGVANRIVITTISLSDFMPDAFAAILNPFILIKGYSGIFLTVILNALLGIWIYNIIINKINWPDKKWTYLGDGEYGGMLYTGSMFILIGAFIFINLIYFVYIF